MTPGEFEAPDDLELACALNGEEMQRNRTRELIFSASALVAKLSGVLPPDVGRRHSCAPVR